LNQGNICEDCSSKILLKFLDYPTSSNHPVEYMHLQHM